MREICFVGKGENLKKISFRLGINSEIPLQKDLVYNNRYVILKEGTEDIQIVRNYNPYFIAHNDCVNLLKDKGFTIVGVCSDKVLYYQPSGVKYSVNPLETIEDISNRFGVSIEDIVFNNKLKTTKLFVGQVLYL